MSTKSHFISCSGPRGVAFTNCLLLFQHRAKVLSSNGPKFPEKIMKSKSSGNMPIYTLCTKSLHSFMKFVRRFKRSMTDGLTDRPVKHYTPCNFVTWDIINIVFRPFWIPLNFLVKNMWWAKTNRWKNPARIYNFFDLSHNTKILILPIIIIQMITLKVLISPSLSWVNS